MSKKKPILVILKKTRHKTQPWTFIIDKPGKAPVSELRERYTTRRAAHRGALRNLGIWDSTPGALNAGPHFVGSTPVVFQDI